MIKEQGIELLKHNLKRVEEKFTEFFEQGQPRWPQEKHDFLRNHYRNIDNFSVNNITLEKMGLMDLPANIVEEIHRAFEAFKNGEAYN